MTIGEKIKSLRHVADVTQEKLAEYLHVSYQAISKWENNTARPDISFIVPLANFFGVTTDELFDIDGRDSQKELDEYDKTRYDLWHEGKVRDVLALCRKVNTKYPKNFTWLNNLADALLNVTYSPGFSDEERKSSNSEAISVCERIMEDCTDDTIRSKCRQTLVMLYDKNGEADKALAEAKKAPSIYLSSEVISDLSWSHNEKTAKISDGNILMYTGLLTNAITKYDESESEEARIKRYETALAIWKLIIDDENYLLYHGAIAVLYKNLAISYANLGNRDKVFENLQKALYHEKEHDALPIEKVHYTATFTQNATHDESGTVKNYIGSNVEVFRKDVLLHMCFKPYRDDPEFRKIFE